MKTFMPAIKSDEELADLQLKGLRWTMSHVLEGSPFYRKKWEETGVSPKDFKSMEDFQNGFFPHAGEFTADMPNYTDLVPQVQISEIVK